MYDRTEQKAKLFDRERERKLPGATLTLILNAGVAGETEVEVEGGWWPKRERKFGEVESLFTVYITDRDGFAATVMSQADRLRLTRAGVAPDGIAFGFNYDPPLEEPRLWTLYAEELKAGGLR